MQKLWDTGMSRRDYISFLEQNEWIWSTEPGWGMEEKLKQLEELKQTGQGELGMGMNYLV